MKRYEEYKDSGVEWIGDIPEEWKISKLKYNSRIKTGYTPRMDQPENYSKDGMVWVKPDLLNGFEPIVDSIQKISLLGKKEQNVIKKDSVLVCCIGTIGKFGVAGVDLLTNQQINSVSFNNLLNSSYGKYLAYSSSEELSSHANGNVVKILNTEKLGNIYYPLPPIQEQTQIANYLDHKTAQLDSLISKKEQLIELLKEERTALINACVTGKLVWNGNAWAEPAEVKDSGIEWLGEIPSHWKLSALKHYSNNITDGAHISPDRTEERYPFVSTVDITDGKIDFDNCIYTSEECYTYLERNRCQPTEGDVLFSKDGTIGKTCIIDFNRNFVVASSLVIISPDKKYLNQYYLDFVLNSVICKEYAGMLLSGSALKRISITKIANMIITIPTIEEQNMIEKFLMLELNKLDEVINKSSQEIALLKEYKTALISEVVTGKVDVRGEVVPSTHT